MPAQDLGQWDQRPEQLRLERWVEGAESGLGARFADGCQMGIDDRGVERFVSQVVADLAQADAFLEQMRGVTVTQAMGGGSRIDGAGGASQSLSHLDGTHAHGRARLGHGLAQGEGAIGPTAAG